MQSYCQSCGMPLANEALLGTDKAGQKSQDYCMYCYELGEFKQPGLTVEEMVEICVPHLKEDGMAEEEARQMLTSFLPGLKRWRREEIKQPTMIERESFQIVGISAQTSNANEITSQAKIPKLWSDFYQQEVMRQIKKSSQ